MKTSIIFLIIFIAFCNLLEAQTKTVFGRVIDDEDLAPITGVLIYSKEKLLLGTSGMDGRFKISIPQNSQTLSLIYIGYEKATINLNSDCDSVEVVLLSRPTRDFISARKIDRERLEQFKKIPDLHLRAYKKGLFKIEIVCYSRDFEPEKPSLDSIEKEQVKIRKQIKLTFEKLSIGDTIKIPFSDNGGYQADGTNRTTLIVYSGFTGEHHRSGCKIKCVIIDKNKHKRAYNLVCKIINCDGCNYPSVYQGREMKSGEVFSHNMKYFEILDD